jgi:hypothetical protein
MEGLPSVTGSVFCVDAFRMNYNGVGYRGVCLFARVRPTSYRLMRPDIDCMFSIAFVVSAAALFLGLGWSYFYQPPVDKCFRSADISKARTEEDYLQLLGPPGD